MFARSITTLSIACASLLAWSPMAMADWRELQKDETVSYYFDKESVMPVHVSRLAWTLTDLSSSDKTSGGASYQSVMTRWRMYCKTDMVVRLSVSYFEKPMGKGKEVAKEDLQEWRYTETPIRPNTYLAALKKEVCSAKSAAG